MTRAELANAIRQERRILVAVPDGAGVIRGAAVGGRLDDSGRVSVWLWDGRHVRVPLADVARPRPAAAPASPASAPVPMPFNGTIDIDAVEPTVGRPTVGRVVSRAVSLAEPRQDGRSAPPAARGPSAAPDGSVGDSAAPAAPHWHVWRPAAAPPGRPVSVLFRTAPAWRARSSADAWARRRWIDYHVRRCRDSACRSERAVKCLSCRKRRAVDRNGWCRECRKCRL